MNNDYFKDVISWMKLNKEARKTYEFLFSEFREMDFQDVRDLFKVSKSEDKSSIESIISIGKSYKLAENKDTEQMLYNHLVSMIFEIDEIKDYKDEFHEYFRANYMSLSYDALIIEKVSERLLNILAENSILENVVSNYEILNDSFSRINLLKDQAVRLDLSRIHIRYLLRAINKEEDKVSFLRQLLSLDDNVDFDNEVKCFYTVKTKPKKIKSIKDLMVFTSELKKKVYYRGHASSSYSLTPSVFRGTMFQHEDDVIKKMMLEIPEEFSSIPTHYEKLLKMQHYGIPTRLLDITTNPLVATFMACDGQDKKDGELILIDKDSFETCYPSSDKIKILSSIAFLPYNIKLVLRFFLYVKPVSKNLFNVISKPLLHEIKHEMASFEPRMDLKDVENYLFVLGPKSNRRIYAQSGHFIVSPLKRNVKDEAPVLYYKEKESRIRFYIPKRYKKKLLKELEVLNIKKHTMYPEIEKIAIGVKHEYM